jgi:hypothetical protein
VQTLAIKKKRNERTGDRSTMEGERRSITMERF